MHNSLTYARSTQNDEEETLDPISVFTKAILDLQKKITILKQDRGHSVDHRTVDLHNRGEHKNTVVSHYCKQEGHVKAKCFKYPKSLNRAKNTDCCRSRDSLSDLRNKSNKTIINSLQAERSGETFKAEEAGMFL